MRGVSKAGAEIQGEGMARKPSKVLMRLPTKVLDRVPTQRALFQKNTNPGVNKKSPLLKNKDATKDSEKIKLKV